MPPWGRITAALVTSALGWACAQDLQGEAEPARRDSGPTPDPETGGPRASDIFNENSYNLGLPVRWQDDGDGVKEEGEFQGLESFPKGGFQMGAPNRFLQILIGKIDWMSNGRQQFIASLRDIPALNRAVVEARESYRRRPSEPSRREYRRALRNRDLATRGVAEMEVDFSNLSDGDQQQIQILLDEAVPRAERIYLAQMDPNNLRYLDEIIERGDPEDLFAFYSFGGVACLSEGVDPICSAHPDSPKPTPNQGFWPPNFDQRERDRLFRAAPVNLSELKSSFVYRVRRDGRTGPLLWRSINAYPPTEADQQGLVVALRRAATVEDGNPSIARFLLTRANELTDRQNPFPFFAGDVAWIQMMGAWDLTLGYYEEYHSSFALTAIFEGFLGVVDVESEGQGKRYARLLPEMEDQVAAALGPRYRRRDLSGFVPLRFLNTVSVGDSRAKYVPAAFYLPNIPPYGRPDLYKKVILLNNQTERLEGVIRPMAEVAFDPVQLARVTTRSLGHFVVAHENAHGAGPHRAYVVRVEGETKLTAGDLLKEHSQPLEEARADLLGVSNLPLAVEQGIITQQDAEDAVISWVCAQLRGLSFGVEDSHGEGHVLIFSTLYEAGAVIETAQGRYAVDLEKIFPVVRAMSDRINRIQVDGDYEEYTRWYRHAIATMPRRMTEVYLPQLREMPKDYFPHYRFRFSRRPLPEPTGRVSTPLGGPRMAE